MNVGYWKYSSLTNILKIFLLYFRHPRSLPFRKPVDSVALGIYPAYDQIITHPIDLGTIKTQIDNGLYTTKDELIADIQLVWNNAKKFNPIGHAIYLAAEFLEKFAHERIGKHFSNLEQFLSNQTRF